LGDDRLTDAQRGNVFPESGNFLPSWPGRGCTAAQRTVPVDIGAQRGGTDWAGVHRAYEGARYRQTNAEHDVPGRRASPRS